ncbi:hypothetical protein, partial [Methanosaeta sp. UBA356]|uniref:hypothetical protein n=1 Tax=Methanosaeta sp. UBA356 TaxID=1915559 RepID=UPI00257E1BBA
ATAPGTSSKMASSFSSCASSRRNTLNFIKQCRTKMAEGILLKAQLVSCSYKKDLLIMPRIAS